MILHLTIYPFYQPIFYTVPIKKKKKNSKLSFSFSTTYYRIGYMLTEKQDAETGINVIKPWSSILWVSKLNC